MLSDPPRSVYIVLIVVTLILAARLFVWQTRRALWQALIPGGLLAALYMTDHFIEAPREEASRKMEAMAAAATASNPTGFVEHVSQSFDEGGRRKSDLAGSPAWGMIKQYKARVAVWGFTRNDFREICDTEIEIGFSAKGAVPDGQYIEKYVKARFVQDGDKQWRLRAIRFYNPLKPEEESPIPGFP